MTAIVLPDIDRSTIDELKKKIPNLAEVELPSMEKVGKTADETIDKLLGRQKSPIWPWVAAGVALVAVLGAVAAYVAWFRRPTWDADSWAASPSAPGSSSTTSEPAAGTIDPSDVRSLGSGGGLSAAESSLSSTSLPGEEA